MGVKITDAIYWADTLARLPQHIPVALERIMSRRVHAGDFPPDVIKDVYDFLNSSKSKGLDGRDQMRDVLKKHLDMLKKTSK